MTEPKRKAPYDGAFCHLEEKMSRSANAVKMHAVIRLRMICPRMEALNHSASLPPRNETPPKTISVAS